MNTSPISVSLEHIVELCGKVFLQNLGRQDPPQYGRLRHWRPGEEVFLRNLACEETPSPPSPSDSAMTCSCRILVVKTLPSMVDMVDSVTGVWG